MIAPVPRIRRRTSWELAHAARMDETVAALARGGPISVDALRAGLAASPFFVARLRALGLAPRDLRRAEDLPAFPTMTRAELAAAWAELPAMGDDLVVVLSSGTTGEPVRVVRDGFDQIYMWGVLRYWLAEHGIPVGERPRIVLADSLPGGLEYSVRLPLVGRGALHRVSVARTDAIARARPLAIFTDPAGLHALPDDALGARLLLTSAQTLPAAVRARFAAPIVDYYSTTETGPIAWACAAGAFHALAPDVWIEAVDGELVVTRLRASALPILRYRTGDPGRVEDGRCACGRAGQRIVGLEGREACWFTTPAGGKVDAWQLAFLFKHHPLDAFRLVQTGPESFRLELERDVPALRAQLAAALEKLGWRAAAISLAPLARAGAKHRPFSVEP